MTEQLMTTGDVAKYFNVTPQAVEKWAREGRIAKCDIPGYMRFNPEYIKSLGTPADITSDRYSPFRCRKLERENKELRNQVEKYQEIITQMEILAAQANLNMLKEVNG